MCYLIEAIDYVTFENMPKDYENIYKIYCDFRPGKLQVRDVSLEALMKFFQFQGNILF
jgi:hypothetical protein